MGEPEKIELDPDEFHPDLEAILSNQQKAADILKLKRKFAEDNQPHCYEEYNAVLKVLPGVVEAKDKGSEVLIGYCEVECRGQKFVLPFYAPHLDGGLLYISRLKRYSITGESPEEFNFHIFSTKEIDEYLFKKESIKFAGGGEAEEQPLTLKLELDRPC